MRIFFNTLLFYFFENWMFFAVIFSFIWGFNAAKFPPKYAESKGSLWDFIRMQFSEFVFHFVCSMTGWFLLHMEYVRYVYARQGFDFIDLVLVVLAMIGISGKFPLLLKGHKK
jgi:hypothetical protein